MNGLGFGAACARDEELPELARLMAASQLLSRYRVTFDTALASLTAAHQAGDVLLAGRLDTATLAGMAWLSFAPRILNGAAYLRLLLVDERVQGIGLGAFLLDAVEVLARPRANHLYLLATTDNFAARRFYVRHGYRHVGDLPRLVLPELDEALYHKALRAPGDRLSG
jgi:GNAT superfamily N-acetyltransferase